MPRRRVYLPDEPKKRVIITQKLSTEAEGLFTLPAKSEQFAVVRGSRTLDDEPKAESTEAQTNLELPPPAVETPDWILQARQVGLLDVAEDLGVDVEPADDGDGFVVRPCPVCGDAAGAAVVMDTRWNVRQWKCPACRNRGGSLDLAALTLMGSTLGKLDQDGQTAVRGWFEGMGWCDAG